MLVLVAKTIANQNAHTTTYTTTYDLIFTKFNFRLLKLNFSKKKKKITETKEEDYLIY